MTTPRQMIKKATIVYVGSPQSKTWVKVTKSSLNNSLQGRVLDPANFALRLIDGLKHLYVNLGATWETN
jgi:hypothetical protein